MCPGKDTFNTDKFLSVFQSFQSQSLLWSPHAQSLTENDGELDLNNIRPFSAHKIGRVDDPHHGIGLRVIPPKLIGHWMHIFGQ